MNYQGALDRSAGHVAVDGFTLDDLTFDEVLARLQNAIVTSRKFVAFALHVGGLLHTHDDEFVRAFNAADCRYADGIASVLLARLSGGDRVERTPTTDLAPALFERFAGGAPLRVALIGGSEGLADRAGAALMRQFNVTVVHASHGFRKDWSDTLATLRAANPQVVLVGMGMPIEAKWVNRHIADLPRSVVITCGGWFGFAVGDEKRAPVWLRSIGCEWVARIMQNPARLAGRYGRGAITTAVLAAKVWWRRLK
jgi:N-acetylglucosaminyldiphosphoundecaprenol N-acetyl-beta-D-mannosaminyltransferase